MHSDWTVAPGWNERTERQPSQYKRQFCTWEQEFFCSIAWFSLWQALVFSSRREKRSRGQTDVRGPLSYQCVDSHCAVTLGVINHCALTPNSCFPGHLHVLFSFRLILLLALIPLNPKTVWTIKQIMWRVINVYRCSASWSIVSFGHLIIKVLRSSALQHMLSVKINVVSMLLLLSKTLS